MTVARPHATRLLRIAVLGTGRAGRARTRAIGASAECELVAAEPMRGGAQSTSLGREDVDAVIISTENSRHYDLAHAALLAGKHVAVEFPLCATHQEACALFDAAEKAERVLHVEVISLLSHGFQRFRAAHRTMREQAMPSVMTSTFTGGSYRWVADEVAAGRLGQLAVGRLHVVRALCGALSLVSARAERRGGAGYALRVELVSDSTRVVLNETRGEDMDRSWLCHVEAAGQQIAMQRATRGEGLFAADLRMFRDMIAEKTDSYVTKREVLDVIALAEQISRVSELDQAK
jgi:predicted dehydrogenase